MKLISLHINGFGALSNVDYSFAPGLNNFFLPNGVGKTSLTDFICCMLYGMKETRANSTEMGLRRHYLPFENPSNYGGSLEIEVGGRRVTIVRSFHQSRRAEDTLTLYDGHGKKLKAPTDKSLGEMFFGIDEDSFKRTVMFASISSGTEAGGTDSINRKLDMTVADIDTKKLSDALAALDLQAKEIVTSRRSHARPGKVNVLQEEVDNLNSNIRELKEVEAALDDKYAKLNKAEADIESLNQQIQQIQQMEREMVVWRQIDGLMDKVWEYDAEAKRIHEKYPKGMPNEDDVTSLLEIDRGITNAQAAMEVAKDSVADANDIAEIKSRYPKGLPSEELVNKMMQARIRLHEMEIEINRLCGLGDDPNLEKDIHVCIGKEKMLAESKRQLEYIQKQDNKLELPKMMTIMLVVALAIAVGLSIMGFGIVGIIVGILAVAVYEFMKFRKKKENDSRQKENVDRLNTTIQNTQNDLRTFFTAHGFTGDDYEVMASEMLSRLQRHRELKSAAEKIQISINRVLSAYGLTADDIDGINRDRNTLEMLSGREAQNQDRYDKIKYSLMLMEQRASKIFENYGITPKADIRSTLDDVNKDVETLQRLNNSKQDVYDHIERIKGENKLSSRPDPTQLRNLDSLRDEYKAIVGESKRLEDELFNDEQRLSAIPEIKEQIAQKTAQIDALNDEYNVIVLTKDFISHADTALKEKYIAPIKNGYLKYINKIGAPLGAQIVMDTDFKVKLLVGGVARDPRHLSDGERTCLELCLRTALVDNMYKGEKPFLIFDDPFTELDADNFGKVGPMMKSLADNGSDGYQILYFTCHNARQI